MEICKICNQQFAYLVKVNQNYSICDPCSLKVIQERFPNTHILNNPFMKENYICVLCFNKAEVVYLSEGYPENYCFECSKDFDPSLVIHLRSVNLSKYKKQEVSSEKLSFLQESLKKFDLIHEEIKQDIQDYKKKLVDEYLIAANYIQEEYCKSIKIIESFERKAEILIKNLANQAKLAVFKKSYENRTEGEDILFSKRNLEFFRSQLKLNITFNSQTTRTRIEEIFKINEIDYFSVFPSKLHSFNAFSAMIVDFTPNLLTKRSRILSETIKWNKGSWIEITNNQVIQNNVEVAGTTGLALISNYNQVELIEKISYVNESGFLAHQDHQLYYLGSESAFKYDLISFEKTQLPKVPYLVKNGSSLSFDSKLVLASQNQPSLLLFDPKKNEYIKKKCDPLKLSKKFLFEFQGKLLILYEKYLFEVLGNCKLYLLSEMLPERFFHITSYKVIEKHVYLLTNDRVVYRLSMINKTLEVITLISE